LHPRDGRSLIARPRLLARIGDASVVLLEAPGGYGKSTITRQLAARLDRPLVRVVLREAAALPVLLAALAQAARRCGLPTIAAAIDPDDADLSLDQLADRLAISEGVVIAIDDVQRATSEAAEWLGRLAERLPSHVRLVLAGRRLGAPLLRLTDRLEAVALGPDALRMDAQEVADVLANGALAGADPNDHRATALLTATEGWPAAVALAAGLPAADRDAPYRTSGPRGVLRDLVADLLEGASAEDRNAIACLSTLPLLSGAVGAAVGGPGTLDRLLDLGLPVRFRPDGWGELPDPVRELLPVADLEVDVARTVARLYAERDALAEAAGLLRRSGDPTGLAQLLGTVGREALVAAGLGTIAAFAAELPDPALAANPVLLVRLVQVSERRPRVRAEWTDRALRLLPDPSPPRRAVDAERALDIARGGDLHAGVALASAVIAAAEPGEAATLGRARYIRGLLTLVADPASASAAAAEEIERAVGLLQAAGERAWEADAWQALGSGCHAVVGRLDAGVACLERAVALRAAQDAARAATLTYLADVQMHRGDLEAAAVAVREAEAIGRRLGDARAIAYAAWSGARLAAERRDVGGVRAALATAVTNPEGWLDQLAGIEFLADGADMLAVCGNADEARAWVARAEARGREVGREDAPLLARARLTAHDGDAATALALLDRLEVSVLAVPRDRWLVWLLRAVALVRSGRRDEALAWLAQARRAVADQGDPGRVERREPELRAIVEPADAGGEPATAGNLVVVLLGRFAVERGGQDVTPPPGRPALLVKLVALRGLMPTAEAIEALWEDADEEVGRARLRNVLNRVRSASGDVLIRQADTLALGPGVVVDAQRFEVEAAAALRAPPASRVGLARAALARATGELLPGDRYADWASAPRERITRRHLALLDLVADDAIARNDLDEAGRLLDEAISLDPLEEERHVRLGRALLRQGRSAAARRVADRAVNLCEELDVEPGEDLARLLRELARQG